MQEFVDLVEFFNTAHSLVIFLDLLFRFVHKVFLVIPEHEDCQLEEYIPDSVGIEVRILMFLCFE